MLDLIVLCWQSLHSEHKTFLNYKQTDEMLRTRCRPRNQLSYKTESKGFKKWGRPHPVISERLRQRWEMRCDSVVLLNHKVADFYKTQQTASLLLSPCVSVLRLRRNSERPSPSPSCWVPWKRWASQPASRRRYGMFWLVFTIWELPGPVKVTLIHRLHHYHSHGVSKPAGHSLL